MTIKLDERADAREVAETAAVDYMQEPVSAAWIPEQPALSPGMRVYGADFADALSGHALRRAHPTGWRFFLLEGETGVSAAIHVVEEDGVPRVSHTSHNPSVIRTVEALTAIEDESGHEVIEVRVFEAPELFFEAVWAVGKTRSWLIPVETATEREPLLPREQDAMEVYLAGVAAERLAAGSAEPPRPPTVLS